MIATYDSLHPPLWATWLRAFRHLSSSNLIITPLTKIEIDFGWESGFMQKEKNGGQTWGRRGKKVILCTTRYDGDGAIVNEIAFTTSAKLLWESWRGWDPRQRSFLGPAQVTRFISGRIKWCCQWMCRMGGRHMLRSLNYVIDVGGNEHHGGVMMFRHYWWGF